MPNHSCVGGNSVHSTWDLRRKSAREERWRCDRRAKWASCPLETDFKVDEIDLKRFKEILGPYQAILAFISTIEAVDDIRYYIQSSVNGKCPMRGCGVKISAKKLLIKHCKSTESVEHQAAYKILTQKWCYQCGCTVKKHEGMDNHLLRKHSESRSRIDLLREYFEPSQYISYSWTRV